MHAFCGAHIENFAVEEENMRFISRDGVLLERCLTVNNERPIYTLLKYPQEKKQSHYYLSQDITQIAEHAFDCRGSLIGIHISIDNPENMIISDKAITDDIFNECILYIPSGTRWAYKHHPVLGKFKKIEFENTDS